MMVTKKTRQNRGQILATAVEGTGLNKEDVATRAGYSRSSYYKHIDNPDLDYHIMMAYGRAINVDFSEHLPDMPKYMAEEPEVPYGIPDTREEALERLEFWKMKYITLLEKYNRLMEEKLSSDT